MSVRLLMKASSVVVLLLLSASVAIAAPAPPRSDPDQSCDPHSTRVRKIPRHPKSFGGPLAPPSNKSLIGLTDITTVVKRGSRAQLTDDDEAIQNDTPAARVDDERPAPGLQPVGILYKPFDRALCSGAFSPRSPRGPPASI